MIGIDVQGAQLDVADATLFQCQAGFLQALEQLLRPHRAVVLVLDLQDIGIELAVGRPIAYANRLPGARRGHGRAQQTLGVGVHVVVAGLDTETLLAAVLVADVTHAQ